MQSLGDSVAFAALSLLPAFSFAAFFHFLCSSCTYVMPFRALLSPLFPSSHLLPPPPLLSSFYFPPCFHRPIPQPFYSLTPFVLLSSSAVTTTLSSYQSPSRSMYIYIYVCIHTHTIYNDRG